MHRKQLCGTKIIKGFENLSLKEWGNSSVTILPFPPTKFRQKQLKKLNQETKQPNPNPFLLNGHLDYYKPNMSATYPSWQRISQSQVHSCHH